MTSTGRDTNEIRFERILAAAFVLIHALILVYLAYYRYIDRDEGFYLSSAFQVGQGKALYTDFFFPQMPFLPYVLSLVTGHNFDTLLYSRLLCFAPACLTSLALYFALRELTAKPIVRLVVMFLYCFAGLVLVWHSVAKTYAWTDLWLLLMFFSLLKSRGGRKIVWWGLAGVAFALAVNFRSVLVVTIIPVAFVLESGLKEERLKAVLFFALTALLISIPTFRLLFADPGAFYFNNLGFHFVRNPGVTFGGAMIERGEAVAKFIIDPQNWIIFFGLFLLWKNRQRTSTEQSMIANPTVLALLFALVIAIVYLFPSPVHPQYFEQALPFLIIAIIPALERMLDAANAKFLGLRKRTGVLLAGIAYLAVLLPFAVIYIGGIRKDDAPYRVRNMTELCQFVNEFPDSGPVLSEWSGVPVLSGRTALPGTEYIGFEYPIPLSTERQRAFQLPVNEDLRKALESKLPALYVVWNQPDSALAEIARRNYHVAREFDQFKVLVRNEATK